MYDFHKKAIQDRKARVYYHPLFQKDNEALLAKIKRKKNSKRSGRNSLSPENKSVSGKQRRTRFLEDYQMTKKYVEALEQRIKELVHSYSYLLDQCKHLALELNSVKKELNKKIELISVLMIDIIRSSNSGSAQSNLDSRPSSSSATNVTFTPEDIQHKEQLALLKSELPSELNKTSFKFADSNGGGGRDVLYYLQGLKSNSNGNTTESPFDLKNIKVPVFANPNQLLDKEKPKITSPKDMLEIMEKADKLSSLSHQQPELTPHDSIKGGQISAASMQGQTPKSDFNYDPLLELQRSNSIAADSLYQKSTFQDQELFQIPETILSSKKKANQDMLLEPLLSPVVNNNHHGGDGSRINSPSHSPAGFKLHASRKNSDLNELNNDLKLTKRASFDDYSHGNN